MPHVHHSISLPLTHRIPSHCVPMQSNTREWRRKSTSEKELNLYEILIKMVTYTQEITRYEDEHRLEP